MSPDDNNIVARVPVRLYMKPGCHLCEQAEADLQQLARRYPYRLERVDITTDPVLMEAYGERIPVLLLGGREYAAPLDRAEIEQALADAHATRPGEVRR